MEGKRILVRWAEDSSSDWWAFRVVKECDDGLFLQGVDAPDGAPHDGSHCFAPNAEIVDCIEWK